MNEKGKENLKKINYYKLFPAEQINAQISLLPTCELVEIMPTQFIGEANKLKKFKAVRVRDYKGEIEYVQVSGEDYKAVQHAEAYRPIIEGITVAGNKDFSFSLNSNFKKAELRIYTGGYGYDGVMIGWKINNGFEGHSKLKYGVQIDSGSQYVELVGYRQSCANGMIIKVPLDKAEYMQPEIVRQVKEKIADAEFMFKHTGNVLNRIETVKYIAEALELLKVPMEAIIKKAGKIKLEDKAIIKELIKTHVGKRYYSRVLSQYETEGQSDLWGLYNAITYVASHDEDLTDSSRELLQHKAADMLLEEIRA